MTIQSVEKRLSKALDDAIELADLGRGARDRPKGNELAKRIYDAEPALMEELKEPWLLEKLAWYINRKRGERWRAAHPQMELPGFEDMPRTIFLRNGERPRLDYATVAQIEDHIKLLRMRARQHDSIRIQKMEAIVQMMRKYRLEGDPQATTWAEVKKKELERRDFERIVGA